MQYADYLRRKQEAATQYIARAKSIDSSHLTSQRRDKAAYGGGTAVHTQIRVPPDTGSCLTNQDIQNGILALKPGRLNKGYRSSDFNTMSLDSVIARAAGAAICCGTNYKTDPVGVTLLECHPVPAVPGAPYGNVTTLVAPNPEMEFLIGTTFDPTTGILYVTDIPGFVIHAVNTSTGTFTNLAGTFGTGGLDDGLPGTGTLGFATGITLNTANSLLYFVDNGEGSDSYSTIRSVNMTTGNITTIAGGVFGYLDDTGLSARFNFLSGIAASPTSLYVVDTSNNCIRAMNISTTVVTTLAGDHTTSGSADGTGTAAQFNFPSGIAIDNTNGLLYVADVSGVYGTIREIDISTQAVETIFFDTRLYGGGEGAPPFNGISFDPAGFLYISNFYTNIIYKYNIATSTLTLLAGNGDPALEDGPPATASFSGPIGLALNSAGKKLYVADSQNGALRTIDLGTGTAGTPATENCQVFDTILRSYNNNDFSAGVPTSRAAAAGGKKFFFPVGMPKIDCPAPAAYDPLQPTPKNVTNGYGSGVNVGTFRYPSG